MKDIKQIADSIDKSQAEAIQTRATSGQMRSFELIWATLVMRHHNFQVVPALTGKQRQNLRDLISRLTPEKALSLMTFSVKNWGRAKTTYPFLPPRPVWDSFYFHRDKFLALQVDEAERESKSVASVGHLKEIETTKKVIGLSLVDMVRRVIGDKQKGDAGTEGSGGGTGGVDDPS